MARFAQWKKCAVREQAIVWADVYVALIACRTTGNNLHMVLT